MPPVSDPALLPDTAAESMAAYLVDCLRDAREPDPEPGLREAFGVHLALLLDRPDEDRLGPPVRSWPLPAEPLALGRMEFSADGARILYETADGRACLAADFGRPTEALPEDAARFASDRWRSPDGRLRIELSDAANVLDAEGRTLRHLRGEGNETAGCTAHAAFDPTGRRVALSYSWDSCVRVFDVESAELLAEMIAPDHEAHLAFSPDGRRLLAGTKNGVRLFLWRTGLSVLPQPRRTTYTVAYHPDGSAILVSDLGPVLHRIDLTASLGLGTPPFESLREQVLEHATLLSTHPGPLWEELIQRMRETS